MLLFERELDEAIATNSSIEDSRMSQPISRRRGRESRTSISSSSLFARNAIAFLTLLSLQYADQSCAWTAKTTLLSKAPIHPTTMLLNQGRGRRRTTTCMRETPVATPIDESLSDTLDVEAECKSETEKYDIDSMSAWNILAGNVLTTLIASDMKRATGMDGGSTGWTSWIEESSSFTLKQCVDRLVFGSNEISDESSLEASSSRDETLRWLKWMKASPSPMVVELSTEFRSAVNDLLTEGDLERAGIIDAQARTDFLSRIGCRMMLLPSGKSLRDNIQTPPGAMVYGKLLYGGATRYRLIGGGSNTRPPRKAGERTTIMPLGDDEGTPPTSKGWVQYGGPDRNYNAIDMGPCGLMEVIILPKDLRLGLLSAKESSTLDTGLAENTIDDDEETKGGDLPMVFEHQPTEEMVVSQQAATFDPQWLFSFPPETKSAQNETSTANQTDATTISEDYGGVSDIEKRFSTVLGGLQPEIQSIIRRVLDGRRRSIDDTSSSSELQTMLEFGLSPVRGLLLYGKPGCGKTALAREISRLLTDRPPKIVAAPELLDRWVGGTENAVRSLFADAEAELAVCCGDPSKSGLHVIVIDEIDAVFRQRSSSSGSGEVSRASAVNQILAKLDGVQALGNILVIGTTNRRELLDDALLRPGRLEVKIEVPLPDREGRREILKIYFGPLRELGRLSQPLCQAIDGNSRNLEVDANEEKNGRVRSFLSERLSWKARGSSMIMRDLASDRWTGGFSGADIEGLVRCAGSIALSRARRDGSGVDGLLITTEDVVQAIQEVNL